MGRWGVGRKAWGLFNPQSAIRTGGITAPVLFWSPHGKLQEAPDEE